MLATPLRVQVSSGPLTGLEGIVAAVTSDGLVTVAISNLPGVFCRIALRCLSVVETVVKSQGKEND
jgi:hypothetical protein